MKRLITIPLIIVLSGCATASSAPNLTPAARNAYNLTQMVNAIGVLQTAAENAVPQNFLKVNTARNIVQFCITANTTIGQVPNGWYASVKAAYVGMKAQLTPDELNKFGLYLSTFETILNSFGPA